MKSLIYLSALIVLLSCSSRTLSPSTTTVIEKERVVRVKDTASIEALMECDSNNQVILKAYSLQSTPNIKQDYRFENGKISVSIENIRDSVIYNYKDSIIFVQQYNANHLTKDIPYWILGLCAMSVLLILLKKRS